MLAVNWDGGAISLGVFTFDPLSNEGLHDVRCTAASCQG